MFDVTCTAHVQCVENASNRKKWRFDRRNVIKNTDLDRTKFANSAGLTNLRQKSGITDVQDA